MLLRTLTFLVWAAVAGAAVFWGAKLLAKPLPLPPQAALAAPAAAGGVAVADLARLLGAEPVVVVAAAAPPPPEASRFQLLGVVAPKGGRVADASRYGVALIALDGKPPRAYRVGASFDGGLVLQQVQARSVAIGPAGGPASLTLELPALPPPATGMPPSAAPGFGGPAAGLPPQPMPGQQPLPQPMQQPLQQPLQMHGQGQMPMPLPGTAPAATPWRPPAPPAAALPVPVVHSALQNGQPVPEGASGHEEN